MDTTTIWVSTTATDLLLTNELIGGVVNLNNGALVVSATTVNFYIGMFVPPSQTTITVMTYQSLQGQFLLNNDQEDYSKLELDQGSLHFI